MLEDLFVLVVIAEIEEIVTVEYGKPLEFSFVNHRDLEVNFSLE
jgi:hypothetical protein